MLTEEMALRIVIGNDLTEQEKRFLWGIELKQALKKAIKRGLTLKEIKQIIKEVLK